MSDNVSPESLFDFEKLKKSNDLGMKWAKRFSIQKNEYLKFIWTLDKNFKEYLNKLEVRYRSQFVKDFKIMFYAREIENAVVLQYNNLCFKVISKFIITEDEMEDYVAEAYNAVRAAVWSFRSHKVKANFMTFCHNSIYMRIQGKKIKEYQRKKRRNSKAIITSASDLGSEYNIEACASKYKPESFVNIDAEIDVLLSECGFDERDTFLLKSFVARRDSEGNWYDEYRQKYKNPSARYGCKQFSRQAIYNQLVRAQTKLLWYLKKANRVPVDFQLPSSHKGMLRKK